VADGFESLPDSVVGEILRRALIELHEDACAGSYESGMLAMVATCKRFSTVLGLTNLIDWKLTGWGWLGFGYLPT
jgi:hypothetical protein